MWSIPNAELTGLEKPQSTTDNTQKTGRIKNSRQSLAAMVDILIVFLNLQKICV